MQTTSWRCLFEAARARLASEDGIEEVLRLGYIGCVGVVWLDRASVGLLGRAEHRIAGQVIVTPVGRAIAMLGREINRGRMRKVVPKQVDKLALDAVDERVRAMVSGPAGGGKPADDVFQEYLSVVEGLAQAGQQVPEHLDILRDASGQELLDTEVRQLGGVLGVNQIRDILIRRARLGEQIIRDRSNSLLELVDLPPHGRRSKRRQVSR